MKKNLFLITIAFLTFSSFTSIKLSEGNNVDVDVLMSKQMLNLKIKSELLNDQLMLSYFKMSKKEQTSFMSELEKTKKEGANTLILNYLTKKYFNVSELSLMFQEVQNQYNEVTKLDSYFKSLKTEDQKKFIMSSFNSSKYFSKKSNPTDCQMQLNWGSIGCAMNCTNPPPGCSICGLEGCFAICYIHVLYNYSNCMQQVQVPEANLN